MLNTDHQHKPHTDLTLKNNSKPSNSPFLRKKVPIELQKQTQKLDLQRTEQSTVWSVVEEGLQ